MLKDTMRRVYEWGARTIFRFGPGSQIYCIWANLYALIYVDKVTRRYQPEVYSNEDLHIPL